MRRRAAPSNPAARHAHGKLAARAAEMVVCRASTPHPDRRRRSAFKDVVVGHCKVSGVAFVPHSPVGGPSGHALAAAQPELRPICARIGCSPHEAMLSWLLQIDDCIVPAAGATRVATVQSIARCARSEFALSDEEIVQFLK